MPEFGLKITVQITGTGLDDPPEFSAEFDGRPNAATLDKFMLMGLTAIQKIITAAVGDNDDD